MLTREFLILGFVTATIRGAGSCGSVSMYGQWKRHLVAAGRHFDMFNVMELAQTCGLSFDGHDTSPCILN